MYYISQKNNSNIYLFIFFDKIYYLLLYSNITYNIHWFYFNPHPNNWRLFIGGTTILNSFKLKKKKIIELTSSVHLSISFAANILRETKPESQSCSSFRPLSLESLSSLLSLYLFLQGCQVAPTLLGIHISVIGAWNTIKSKDMNPNIISSEKGKNMYPTKKKC